MSTLCHDITEEKHLLGHGGWVGLPMAGVGGALPLTVTGGGWYITLELFMYVFKQDLKVFKQDL